MGLCAFAHYAFTLFSFLQSCRNDPLQDGCTFSDGSTGACPMSDTVDSKAQEDGLAVESVQVGVACGHLVAVACGENNGVCLLYDISEIETPELIKTFHLSPASRSKNPEQSYRNDMGDLDSETILFLSPETSPTGKAGFVFGGAISGTLSFYEFQCNGDDSSIQGTGNIVVAEDDAEDELEAGAIAGIVIACVVGVVLFVFVARSVASGNSKDGKEIDTGAAEASETREYA